MSWPPFLPIAASREAAGVDAVMVAVHNHVLLLLVAWGLLFAYAVWRFRDRPGAIGRRSSPRVAWVVAAVGLVVAGDAWMLAARALPAWYARTVTPPAADALTVRVVAEQFAWNVHYPGPDGAFGATRPDLIGTTNPLGIDRQDPAAADDLGLLNVLTVPAGRTTLVELTSRDVIHAFTLREMRVKQDATPGMTTRAWFTPAMAGQWEIGCSQLCGLGHYRMKGIFTVLDAEAWGAWLATEVARIPPGPSQRP